MIFKIDLKYSRVWDSLKTNLIRSKYCKWGQHKIFVFSAINSGFYLIQANRLNKYRKTNMHFIVRFHIRYEHFGVVKISIWNSKQLCGYCAICLWYFGFDSYCWNYDSHKCTISSCKTTSFMRQPIAVNANAQTQIRVKCGRMLGDVV